MVFFLSNLDNQYNTQQSVILQNQSVVNLITKVYKKGAYFECSVDKSLKLTSFDLCLGSMYSIQC